MGNSTETIKIGDRFGRWSVIEDQPWPWTEQVKCKCECGTVRKVKATSLRAKRSNSCGCLRKEANLERGERILRSTINEGDVFERITVTRVESSLKIHYRCVCGTEKVTTAQYLRTRKVRSCGCLRKEMGKLAARNKIHDRSRHTLYSTWLRLSGAVSIPGSTSWHLYGAKGAKMYEPWITDVGTFIDGVEAEIGPRPSSQMALGRIDETGDIEPGNLCWLLRGSSTRHTPYPEEDDEKVLELVRGGMSQAAAARAVDVRLFHVHWIVKQARKDGRL